MNGLANYLTSNQALDIAQLMDKPGQSLSYNDLLIVVGNAFAMIDRLEREIAQLKSRAKH